VVTTTSSSAEVDSLVNDMNSAGAKTVAPSSRPADGQGGNFTITSSRPAPIATTPSTPPAGAATPMTNAQIQAKAQQMLAQGVDKLVVAAFIKQQKALQEVQPSPATTPVAATVGTPIGTPVSPYPQGNVAPFGQPGMSYTAPMSGSPGVFPPRPQNSPRTTSMTNDEIQAKAKEMIAQGIDNMTIATFIKQQQAIQLQVQQQQQLQQQQMYAYQQQTPAFRIQHTGPYQQRAPSGLMVCYECRYEMTADEKALQVANR